MIKSFALIAIAALSLAACSKKEAPINNENEMITLKFNIKNADDATTRALLGTDSNGNRFLNWEDGDQIGSFAEGTFGSYSTSNNNAGTVEVNGDNFTLNIQTFNSGNVTKIYSYYPFSSAAGKEKTAAIVSIPATQYITVDGFDADAMPMAGAPVTVDLATAANTDTPCGTINFSNLGSIINFKIYSSEDTDETLTSVKYVASSGKLGGSYTIDLTAIDAADESTLALGGNGSESEITTIHQGKPAIGTGKSNAIDVYMVVAPGTYSGTQVVVTTSAKTYTLTASGEKTYVRSHVKPMYVDIQKGEEGELPQEETWVKVTSVSDFTAGTYYILNWDEKKYLPNIEAGTAPSAKDFMGNVTDDMKWEATVSNDGLIFKNPESELYLWGRDDNNNGVRVKKEAPANSSAKVWKFSSNSEFGIVASVGSNRYLATYNNSGTQRDWRNYAENSLGDGTHEPTGTQTIYSANNYPAVFYKLQSGEVPPQKETPELIFSNPTATVNVGETVTNVASITPSTLTITYSSSNDEVATVTNAGVVTGVAAGTATITAAFAGDDDYNAVSASYTITVVDPNANDGSAEKPYTASEAIAIAKNLGSNVLEDVHVKGIVCTTGTVNATYNSVTYYISNDGSEESRLQIYGGLYIDGANFTAENNLKKGDYVVVCGKLKYYNNSTPEIDANSVIKSIVRAPSFSPDGGTFATDNISVEITAETGAVIRYTLDGTKPTMTTGSVYESAITISETTTINAIAIKGGVVTGVVTKTFTKTSNTSVNVAFDYPTLYSDVTSGSRDLDGVTDTVDGVSVTYLKVEGNNTPKYYANGTNLRIYNKSTMTFVAPTGKKITAIDFSQGATTWVSGKMSGDSGSVNDNTQMWSNTSGANSVVLTITGSFKFTKIVVTYE